MGVKIRRDLEEGGGRGGGGRPFEAPPAAFNRILRSKRVIFKSTWRNLTNISQSGGAARRCGGRRPSGGGGWLLRGVIQSESLSSLLLAAPRRSSPAQGHPNILQFRLVAARRWLWPLTSSPEVRSPRSSPPSPTRGGVRWIIMWPWRRPRLVVLNVPVWEQGKRNDWRQSDNI